MRDVEPTPPAGSGEGQRTFYVINLCAAPVPLPLEVPGTSGLDGLVVFRSHQVQDGRHRYRLHLGYFDTREAAERVLPRVLPRFPTAWITTAPRAHLGSLDDTGATDFRLIQAPSVPPAGFSPAEPAPAGPEAPADAGEEAHQRYAVQLVWSSDRTGPADLPPIAIFEAYTLYTVTCQRGGVRLYGVRLGFFRSAISASQVAIYVRPDFPSVAVVPVSDREFAYASWLVRHRVPMAQETESAPQQRVQAPPAAQRPSTPTATRPPRTATPIARAPRMPAASSADASPGSALPPVDEVPWTSVPAGPRTPTQVEIAQIRSPDEIPLFPSEPAAAQPAPRISPPPRPGTRRVPDPDRDARIAALGAHEIKLRGARDTPAQQRVTLNDMRPARSSSFPDERSVLSRLISRFTHRHD